MEILKVNDLRTYFQTLAGIVKAVDGVSFSLQRGETLGIVGESGAGKSVTAHTVMGLAGAIGARVVSGEVWYGGKNLLAAPEAYRQVRGKKIALIPQEAGAALNPVLTVADQLGEMLKVHLGLGYAERRVQTRRLLEMAELPDPDLTAGLYPHQLSGGILQRVLLAMALSCAPDIIIADEPASSLDVTVQAEILKLLKDTKDRNGLSMILITHDLGLIYHNCDSITVWCAGRIVEAGFTHEVLSRPLHPYTAALLDVYKCLGEAGCGKTKGISAAPNDNGCVFTYTCPRAIEVCRDIRPVPVNSDGRRVVACHRMYG